jgi:hypothetical protein
MTQKKSTTPLQQQQQMDDEWILSPSQTWKSTSSTVMQLEHRRFEATAILRPKNAHTAIANDFHHHPVFMPLAWWTIPTMPRNVP